MKTRSIASLSLRVAVVGRMRAGEGVCVAIRR